MGGSSSAAGSRRAAWPAKSRKKNGAARMLFHDVMASSLPQYGVGLMSMLLAVAPWLPAILAAPGPAQEPPSAPVPPSPYLAIVYRYADALLEERARSPAGFDAGRDGNFLRILYVLSGLSGKPKYRDAADRELKTLLQADAAGGTRLPFGERRAWLLWDRCFELDREGSRRMVLELTKAAVDFDAGSPRLAGFMIRALAAGHRHTGDAAFLRSIAALLEKLEAKRASDPPPAHRLSLSI